MIPWKHFGWKNTVNILYFRWFPGNTLVGKITCCINFSWFHENTLVGRIHPLYFRWFPGDTLVGRINLLYFRWFPGNTLVGRMLAFSMQSSMEQRQAGKYTASSIEFLEILWTLRIDCIANCSGLRLICFCSHFLVFLKCQGRREPSTWSPKLNFKRDNAMRLR